jgi:hypothetical protein
LNGRDNVWPMMMRYVGDVVVVVTLLVVVELLAMIKYQASRLAKTKQSHWSVMISTCSYVGG